jgi:hypothetical protein
MHPGAGRRHQPAGASRRGFPADNDRARYTADLLIRPINSRRLADELARLGVISELVEFAECNHEFDAAPSYAVAVVAHIDVFLRRVLHEPTLAAEMRQYSMFR